MKDVSVCPTGSSKVSVEATFLSLFCLLVPVSAFLFWTQRHLPSAVSEHGKGIDAMINYLLLTVGMLLVIGHVVLACFIWRFSCREYVTFRLTTLKSEWKWALVPLVAMSLIAEGGVLVIGMPVWRKVYPAGAPADAITVEVTAEQFVWNIRYPGRDGLFGCTDVKLIDEDNTLGLDPKDKTGRDDIVLIGQLYLPINRPVHLRLRSKDVLHSFCLPHQRVKQDTVPGMVIDAWFVPTQIGDFEILCTELCGLGHYKMRGILHVLSQQEFERWLNQKTA